MLQLRVASLTTMRLTEAHDHRPKLQRLFYAPCWPRKDQNSKLESQILPDP